MRTFKDTKGREWTVELNVSTIKRVRDLVKVDLLALADTNLLDRLTTDPVLLCDVLCAVCRPEAEKREVSDVDFGEGLAGDAIDHATKALLEEWVNFYPNQRGRATLTKVLGALWTAIDRTQDVLAEKMTDEALEMLIQKATDEAKESLAKRTVEDSQKRANGLSGKAPVSSASTPAP